LHKALELYTETKQWRRAIDMLAALAATETEASRRRSKYHYAAAVIARDELDDVDLAIEHFQLALEDDPGNTRAFDAIDQALRGRGDYKNLARAYRKMLKRLGEEAPVDILLPLWTKLGEICLEQLEDTESAIAAFEVASSLDPDGRERHEQLAELYLEVGESRRQDAIEELQYLVQSDPDRVELYRALSNLYREEGELDKAFCLAQALVFLKAASAGEVELYQKVRPPQLVLSKRRLTEELWQKAILHGREDRHVNAIFASLIGEIASSAAQPPSAYHLASKDRIDVAHEPRPVARMVKYAAALRPSGRRRGRHPGGQHDRSRQAGPGAPGRRSAGRADGRARARLRPRQADGVPASRSLRELRDDHASDAGVGVQRGAHRRRPALGGRRRAGGSAACRPVGQGGPGAGAGPGRRHRAQDEQRLQERRDRLVAHGDRFDRQPGRAHPVQ
jgi:hypothetical protein